jgi:hypothetical protein
MSNNRLGDILIGLLFPTLGVWAIMRPEIGRGLFALDYHREMANRHPRLYRIVGFWWIIESPRAFRILTEGFGLVALSFGALILIAV